jgi:endo-1,4-beta-xylanase
MKTYRNILSCFLIVLGLSLSLLVFISCKSRPPREETQAKGLKDYYADNFMIGAAIFPALFDDPVSADLIKAQFSTITPENQMKWAWLHPTPGEYKFEDADKIADFARANNIKLIGHTLVWHSQLGQGMGRI